MKDFLNKTWVKVVAWAMALLGSGVLIVDGVTPAEIGSGIELVAGIISTVGLLIAFIIGKVTKRKRWKPKRNRLPIIQKKKA